MTTFAPRVVWGETDVTAAPFSLRWGFDFGGPVTLYDAVASLMVDGTIATSPGDGNREGLVLPILVDGDSRTVAEYGEQLEIEAAKPYNTLTFYPGDGSGAPIVFDTFIADVKSPTNMRFEEAGFLQYDVTIPALPFVRPEDPVTINWTDSATELDPLTSLTGWTMSGTAPTVVAGGFQVASLGTTTFTKTLTLDNYLWIKVDHNTAHTHATAGDLVAATVNGVAVDIDTVRVEVVTDRFVAFTIPTHGYAGQSVPISFTLSGTNSQALVLQEIWRLPYPRKFVSNSIVPPRGLDVIDIEGAQRSPCVIRFTAPSGGAWIITTPDPDVTLRDRGAPETVFGVFEVTDADGAELAVGSWKSWHPQGTHAVEIGRTLGQPAELSPDGIWPQQHTGTFTATGVTGGHQFAYPVDPRAAVTFYDTAGTKAIISPTPALPEGYHGGAVHHDIHALHPPYCGFAVLDINGAPIAATIEYYPRWKFRVRD